MLSPQKIPITPEIAKNGPNAKKLSSVFFLNIICVIPKVIPAIEAKIIIKGSIFRPSHAPNKDNNLKSP